ncbi:oxidoreductase [Herbiconiux sp. SALV-R1]|nr:oxidoreductase [Herbiconiux sp. SALV-R1]
MSGTPRLDLRVREIRWEADGVVSLVLVDPAGAELPEWQPGAHLEIVLPSGLVRQYSLCGDVADRSTYRVSVLREEQGRGGSLEIHDTALVGRVLEVRGPRNHFELRPAGRYVFIAGGIGVTPILPMIRSLPADAIWELHYAGRSLSTMAFVDELRALDAGRVHLAARDEGGRLDIEQLASSFDDGVAVYCCGPARLLEAVEEAVHRLAPGVRVTTEKFASSLPGSPKPVPEGGEREFEIELPRRGVRLRVPVDRSILDVVREVVPGAPSSCEEGYCGSCETRILAGLADHRDEILTPEEREANQTVFTCVSRSFSDTLVLDL